MFDRLLIATDGSAVAERAGEYAHELADRFGAELHVVSVEEDGGLLGGDEPERSADRAAAAVTEPAAERGIDVTTAVLESDGPVHAELVAYAEAESVDLLVMGTHGRTGLDRFLVGSVATQTLRESPVPVATVHDETDLAADFGRILLPTDGSESALAAAERAVDLADAAGGRLHVVHVSDRVDEATESYDLADPDASAGVDAVDEVLELARDAGLETVEASVLGGRPDQAILAVAAEHDVGCIVMGAHGRSGIRRYLLGSTTERVVRFAGVPVVSVRAPRLETVTVDYLDYAVVDERGWSLDDEDLFERAAAADLDGDAYGSLEVAPDEYLLDAAEAAGHDWPFYCRAGGCVNCAAVVVEGEIEMDVQRSLSDEEIDELGIRLTCVGTPGSEQLSIVYNAQHLDELRDRVV